MRHEYSNRADWLVGRRNYIGASEIAAILELPTYSQSGSAAVYVDKTRGGEQKDDWEDHERMYAGLHFESAAMEWFRRRCYPDSSLEPNGLVSLTHDDFTWAGCTPDGWLHHPQNIGLADSQAEGVECKWLSDAWGFPPTDGEVLHFRAGDELETPEGCRWISYVAQCQWSMAVTGALLWYLVIVARGNQLLAYAIHRDENDIAYMLSEAEKWWTAYVMTKTPPPISLHDRSANQAMRRLYPVDNGTTVELDAALEMHVTAMQEAKLDRKLADAAKDYHQAKIQRAMKASTHARCGPYQLSWKAGKSGARIMRVKEAK